MPGQAKGWRPGTGRETAGPESSHAWQGVRVKKPDNATLVGYQPASCVHTGLGLGWHGEAMALLCQRLGPRTHTEGAIL